MKDWMRWIDHLERAEIFLHEIKLVFKRFYLRAVGIQPKYTKPGRINIESAIDQVGWDLG